MTPEQLAAARATHWRQDAQPLLTLEDATSWLERMQLALYLPRKSQLLAPAPSFVEAVSGEGSATPGAEAIAQAHGHLVRMVAEGTAVPLNLFGTPGEQPDFLITIQALPHLAALQADRNWKKPPSRTGPGKVSPLAIEIWKLLDSEGAMTANDIRTHLGHELTEAATIRGLSELWQNMRVAPLPQGAGEPAEWELLSVTHKKAMAAAGTMSQSAALSMLVSNYLQSVVTGTGEDIEAFLSPVASRSRLRDVIRGLTATRQLKSLSMDAQTFLFIEGTLPDMPEVTAVSAEGAEAKPAFMGRSAYRERMLNRGKEEEEKPEEGAPDRPSRAPFRPGSDRPRSDRPGTGRPGFGRPDRAAAPRRFAAGGSAPSSFRARPAAGDRDGRSDGPRRSFGSKPFGAKPFAARPFGTGAPRSGEDRPRSARPFTPRAGGPGDGERSSFKPRTGFDKPRTDFGKSGGYGKDRGTPRPSFGARSTGSSARSAGGDSPRPFRPRTEGDRPRSGTGGSGAGRPFTPREGRPFTPREGGRPAFSDRSKPFRAKPFSDRPRSSSDRPNSDRAGSDRPRPFSDRKPFAGRSGDDSGKNSSRAGFMSRAGGRAGRPAGDRPRPDRASGDRPSAGRPRPPRADGDRPYTPRPSGGAGGGARPFSPRPRDGESRPPRKFDGKPSFPRRDAGAPRGGSDSRPPRTSDSRREGGSSGYPSNPNRPSRAPKAGGSFVKRDGAPSRPGSGRPSAGGRPPARGGKPGFGSRPGAARPGGAASPGRNPGGTGRPGGPRVGGGAGRPSSGRPSSGRPASSRPGGMKPPTRKPRPEKDSE